MAEILILAQDKHMPAVEEWRKAMTDRAVPQAQAFMATYPDAQEGITNMARLVAYTDAVRLLQAVSDGKAVITPEERDAAFAVVLAYQAAPLAKDKIDRAVWLHRDRTPTEPSIATQWKYHRNIVDAESRKTDLVKAVELAEKDRRGCAKRGDFIEVADDGADWGRACKPPKWVILKLPGISRERVRRYIQPEYRQDGFEDDGTTPRMALYRKREWHFLVDNIPLAARQKLAQTGELTIGPTGDYTWLQVKTFVHNKRTNTTETEDL